MKVCKIVGCDRSAERQAKGCRGMCAKHYAQWRRTGSPHRKTGRLVGACFGEPGCTRPDVARGLCMKHYKRFHLKGILDDYATRPGVKKRGDTQTR